MGQKTIPKVDKIVGPGNVYVTAAKMACGTAIDFPAGPSEVLIIADESARADFIASDMIAQAEHDPNAVSVLVTPSEDLAKQVMQEIDIQIKEVAREEIIKDRLRMQPYSLEHLMNALIFQISLRLSILK